ncbi:hypothetical protein [Actinacidiphila bryophytorum]|uniref:Tetratricopeptide repeat protein n=1 Tax=Actinacidiphila bryophytorum TaxID=1436133 RepID=A0A9W4H8U8_9ACTN|nr:hypothetical protein [Actinacidiphila bryophytorum]MBM9440248.1 hypothetical protein [Actinacidiphila bryophytorum]MBN6545694.1 hypothetical protein [Actinacidiphila bryophytorum]CAG7658436.1 Tetratricopeptide repeat protein [Actinacidiphila bryophytorum]
MDAELASLWGPGSAALVTLLVTDTFTSVKARLGRLFGRTDPVGEAVLPGELAEAGQDLAAARARGDSEAAGSAAAALEDALRAALTTLLRERPDLAPQLRDLLAEAIGQERTATAPPSLAAQHPARLPRITVRPMRHYQNNEDLLLRMDTVVAERAAAGVPAFLYLTGIPGIGKDALARRWLQRNAGDLTGPQLEASLGRDTRGNPPSPAAVLEGWLRRLGVPVQDLPAEPADLLGLLARTVHGRRAVFLLTDVMTPAQVRQLVPEDGELPDSVVLLTSRSLLPGLVGGFDAEPLTVGPLDGEHSRRLLVGVGRLDPDTAGTEAVRQITAGCDGLPLALVAVGAQLAVGPPGLAEEVAAALSRAATRMDALSADMDEDMSVSAALTPGYRDLDPETARVYRSLGLHPTAEFETDVLRAALPDMELAARHRALRRLTAAGLVQPVSGTRYRFAHPLIHSHALERARTEETAAARDRVTDQVTAFYLEVLERSEAALSGRHRHDPAGVYPGYAPTAPVDEAAVVAGLERRHDTLCQAVRLAHEAGRHEQAWRMAQAMHTYFLKTRRHTDWIRVHQWGVASARETNDLLALARMHFETGFAHQDRCSADRRDPQEARTHLDAAMELVAAPGRTPTEAERRTRSSALEALGLLAAKMGAPHEALARIDQAAEALGGIAHPRGRALFALHRGTFHALAGEHDLAEAQLLAAHDGFAALAPPNRFNQAKALTRYAEDRRAAGLTAAALDAADRALAALDGQGTPYQTADILLLRGTLHGESGGSARAAADLAAARDIFRALTSPRAADAAGLLARYGGGASPGGDVE